MKKSTFFAMLILEILSLLCGGAGFYFNKNQISANNKPNNNNQKNNYKIRYKYYLDNVEQYAMPTNNTSTPESEEPTEVEEPTETDNFDDITYSFDKYICTNDVTGHFDTEKWEFIPDTEKPLTEDATCKLYFVKNIFELTLNVTNGKADELSANNNRKVKKDEKISYTIKPNDGYTYDNNSYCNNGAQLNWNPTTNILTVSEVTANTTCNINYNISSYNINITVENGTSEIQTLTVEHNKDAEFTLVPNENMVYDTVICNPQIKATYETETNKLKLTNVTKNSNCTVKYKQNAFKVTLNVINGTVSGEATKDVKKTGYVLFDIKENDGYTINKAETVCNNGKIELNGALAKVFNVTQDTECTITLNQVEQSEPITTE